MNFHPLLQTMIKVTLLNGVERALCPFCQEPMEIGSKINPTLYCECSKGLSVWDLYRAQLNEPSTPFYSQMSYRIIVNKKMTIHISVDFQNSTTDLLSTGSDLDIKVPHIKFPFFNEMAMRHKLKNYLLFL